MGFRAVTKSISALLVLGFLSACNSSSIPGIQTYDFNVQNDTLFADFVATTIQIPVGATLPIPNFRPRRWE